MPADDLKYMRLAIDRARQCVAEGGHARPKVGAVIVLGDEVIAAFRGEIGAGDHAEYTLLEKKLRDVSLVGATVYTTLEPCTVRNPPKVSCAERLIERKIKRVVIGTLDPNPEICGRGERLLRDHNIVVDRFPHDLIEELDDLNRDFNRAQRAAASTQDKHERGQRSDSHGGRKVLTVYMASAGDVAKEMEIAREAVEDINKVIHGIDWAIDLRGLEDSLRGHGRSQATAIADVQASQLFIGLLCAKWGHPSGAYSSAFEEQYETARKEGDRREVWLYFKKVPNAQLVDPGEQLSKVLAFRQRIELNRDVVYKDLSSAAEWKRQLPQDLYKHVLAIHERNRPQAEIPSGAIVRSNQTPQEGAVETNATDIPAQIVEVLTAVGTAAHTPKSVGPFQAARLHLLSTSMLASHMDIRLGVHELNSLYKYREQLDAADYELQLILRSIIVPEHDVTPGWYWFRGLSTFECISELFRLAIFAREEAVRVRATNLLVRAAVIVDFPAVPREDLLQQLLADNSQAARSEKLKYIATVGDLADLPILDRAADNDKPDSREGAAEARALLLARHDPDHALASVTVRRQTVPASVLAVIRNDVQRVQISTLMDATKHPDETVRRFAVEELDRRGEWTAERALALKDDTAPPVKALSYRALVRAGRQVDLDSSDFQTKELVRPALLDRLRLQPLEALQAERDWYSQQGIDAYEAAANQYPTEMIPQIRLDLTDQFAGLRHDSLSRLRSRFGPEQALSIEQTYSKHIDDYLRSQYTRIALFALARYGTKDDVTYGRKYLLHQDVDVRHSAVALVAEFGDVSDCSDLIAVAKNNWNSKREAAQAAVRVCGGSIVTIRSLIDAADPIITAIGLDQVTSGNREAFSDLIRQLLVHDLSEIRRLAVATLVRLWTHDELEVLLTTYINQGRYFYNVAYWLDRALYAPQPLRDVFVQDLQQHALGSSGSILDGL